MAQKNIFLAFLLLAAVFSSAEAATHAYCPAGATLQLTSTPVAPAAAQNFDQISYFEGPNKDSLPILVAFGDATNPFTMKNMKVDGTYSAVGTCAGSADHEFSGLLRQHLVLKSKDATPVFKLCSYTSSDNAHDITMTVIPKKTGNDDYKSFVPITFDATNIFFSATTVNDLMVVARYPWTDLGNVADAYNAGEAYDDTKLITHRYVYDKKGYFQTRTGWTWAVDTVITAADVTEHNVDTFPLVNLMGVVALTDSASLHTGSVYTVSNEAATKVDAFTISAAAANPIEFKYYSDNLYNFGRVSAGNFAWVTLTIAGAFWKSSVAIDTTNLFNVGLARNKATFLYTTGTMTVLEHQGDGVIAKVLENKKLGGSTALDSTSVDAGNQVLISFSCICKTINAFVCFPETLNCVVINQAKKVCNFIPDTSSTW